MEKLLVFLSVENKLTGIVANFPSKIFVARCFVIVRSSKQREVSNEQRAIQERELKLLMENQVNVTPGFCPNCGSILPPLKSQGGVACFLCSKDFDPSGENQSSSKFQSNLNQISFSLRANGSRVHSSLQQDSSQEEPSS